MIAEFAFAVQVFAQAGPGSSIVTPPIESHTTTTVNLVAPPPDKVAIGEATVESTNAVMTMVVVPPLIDWNNQLFNLPDLWRHTPDDLTWNNSGIRGMAELTRNVALGLLVLAIVVYGIRAMLGQGLFGWGRVMWGTIMALGELLFWEYGIKLNNAINDTIGAPDLPSLIRPHLAFNANPGQAAGNAMLVIVYAVVSLLVMLSLLFRLGLLQVLIAIGPLALFCAATEQSEHFASRYAGLSAGLLFSQIMIVIGLKVATVDATVGTGIAGTFMGLVVLLIVRKLPGLVSSMGNSGPSGSKVVRVAALARRAVGAVL